MRPNNENDFWARVARSEDETSCWPWLSTRNHEGFGVFGWEGRVCQARKMAAFFAGMIPSPRVKTRVFTACGNRLCMNPNHLTTERLKSHAVLEAKRRARAIRDVYYADDALAQIDVADVMGVSKSLVNRVLKGKEWRP
jgi:hypothetical protein